MHICAWIFIAQELVMADDLMITSSTFHKTTTIITNPKKKERIKCLQILATLGSSNWILLAACKNASMLVAFLLLEQ
jgi:uracil phosphoribosyltransferase